MTELIIMILTVIACLISYAVGHYEGRLSYERKLRKRNVMLLRRVDERHNG